MGYTVVNASRLAMVKERGDYVTRFKSKGIGTRSGQKPISVLLPVSIDPIVRSLSNRSKWIREAIMEKLKRDELVQQATNTNEAKLTELLEPLTSEQKDKAIAVLDSWCDVSQEEAQEQRETGELLFKALDEERARIGARKLFP